MNGQTAVFYAALQVRVKQIPGSQWAVVRWDVVEGSRYHVASVVVRSKGCVKKQHVGPFIEGSRKLSQGSVNS